MPDIDGIFSVEEIFAPGGHWLTIYDCMAEITDRAHTIEECRAVWDALPRDIRGQARLWGIETEVRDQIYDHLRDIGWTGR